MPEWVGTWIPDGFRQAWPMGQSAEREQSRLPAQPPTQAEPEAPKKQQIAPGQSAASAQRKAVVPARQPFRHISTAPPTQHDCVPPQSAVCPHATLGPGGAVAVNSQLARSTGPGGMSKRDARSGMSLRPPSVRPPSISAGSGWVRQAESNSNRRQGTGNRQRAAGIVTGRAFL
jgi:hypothetical protein